MRRTNDDGGQLMLLAGIVLTLSFVATALTLAQVSSVEREAAREGPSAIVAEWRFLHERVNTSLNTGIAMETTATTYLEMVLPTAAAGFRAVMAEKGYDLILRAAGGPDYATTGNEESLVVGANYDAWSRDGTRRFTHAADSNLQDGVIWQAPCPPTAVAGGCIQGVYVYVRLSDGVAVMEESVLLFVNRA